MEDIRCPSFNLVFDNVNVGTGALTIQPEGKLKLKLTEDNAYVRL